MPCPPARQSGKNHWPILMPPKLLKLVCSLIIPCSNAATAMTGLITDPDGYSPLIHRLNKGLSGLLINFWYSWLLIPRAKALLSYAGKLAIANISPLFGSIITAAALVSRDFSKLAFKVCSNFFCNSISKDKTKLWPSCASS